MEYDLLDKYLQYFIENDKNDSFIRSRNINLEKFPKTKKGKEKRAAYIYACKISAFSFPEQFDVFKRTH